MLWPCTGFVVALALGLLPAVALNLQTGLEADAAPSAQSFLRRRFHAAVLADKYLYIDGGQVSYLQNNAPTYAIENSTLALDLSKDWQNSTVQFFTTEKPRDLPNINLGVLFYHAPSDTIYSGFAGDQAEFSKESVPNPTTSIWTLKPDGSGHGTWSQVTKPASELLKFNRPTRALTAQSADTGFVLNGQSIKAGDAKAPWLPGMLTLNMSTQTFSNISTSDVPAFSSPLQGGALQHVPTWGAKGLLLAFGGIDQENVRADNTKIPVYDIAANTWFMQLVTGEKPPWRQWQCVAGLQSTNGTFEIFHYGGYSHFGPDSMDDDDIYILTLPAFNWVRVNYPATHPRGTHTCTAVGGAQILVIGGLDPMSISGQDFIEIDQHTMATPDPFTQGLGVYDLTTLSWKDHFSASAPPYQQSDPVKQYYQQHGKDYESSLDPHFSNLLKGLASTASSTPSHIPSSPTSTASPSSSTKKGAIAGGVVGGLVFIALVAGLIFFLRRCRQPPPPPPKDSKFDSPWSPQLDGNAMSEVSGNSHPPEADSAGYHEVSGAHPITEVSGAPHHTHTYANGDAGGGRVHELNGHWHPDMAGGRLKE